MTAKTKQLITLILIGAVCISLISFVGCKKKTEPSASAVSTSTEGEMMEQTTCPVMGGAINKDFYTEYEGKKVYFCCPDCKEKFAADPEKYLDKLPQFKK